MNISKILISHNAHGRDITKIDGPFVSMKKCRGGVSTIARSVYIFISTDIYIYIYPQLVPNYSQLPSLNGSL